MSSNYLVLSKSILYSMSAYYNPGGKILNSLILILITVLHLWCLKIISTLLKPLLISVSYEWAVTVTLPSTMSDGKVMVLMRIHRRIQRILRTASLLHMRVHIMLLSLLPPGVPVKVPAAELTLNISVLYAVVCIGTLHI
jgi:hypothetical protein